MSEYQYYEFTAIDKVLTAKQQAELRAISTRAKISERHFINEYHWGDLNADAQDLLLRYFDAHVYVANWSGWEFCLRLPLASLNKNTLKAYGAKPSLCAQAKGEFWLLRWQQQEDDDYDRYAMASGDGWMAKLRDLRAELLQGDYRALYLGWLAAVSADEVGDDEREPPLPAGMSKPSPAQRALIDFIGIDPDLVSAAGLGDVASTDIGAQYDLITHYLSQFSDSELRRICSELLQQPDALASRLLRPYADWRQAQLNTSAPALRRSVAELKRLAAQMSEQRLRKQARADANAQQKVARERARQLAALAADFPAHWRQLDVLVAGASATTYRQAIALLQALADAYVAHAAKADFEQMLQRFVQQYKQRRGLMTRLRQAGFT